MDFYKDFCCGTRQELHLSNQTCSSRPRRCPTRSPIVFGMTLTMNPPGMTAYAAMNEEQNTF